MVFAILIPCLFIFLYCLYKLTKDDYVLIRKNVTVEQMFDMLFIAILLGLFGARLLYLLLHPIKHHIMIMRFFSPQVVGFSLTGAVITGAVVLYLFSNYRRIPLGRFLDFVTLSFLITLPIGFAGYSLFFRNDTTLLLLIAALLYFLLSIFFLKFLYPRLLNRTLHEGNLTFAFLIYFSLTSLFLDVLQFVKRHIPLLTPEHIILVCLFLVCLLSLLSQHKFRLRKR